MGCDIHIFMEIKEDGKWILTKDKIFPYYEEYKKELEDIQKDDIKAVESIFTDKYNYLKAELHWVSRVTSEWIFAPRNYFVFAVLSDVRNSGEIPSFKKGKDYKDGWPGDCVLDVYEVLDYHSFTTYYEKELPDLKEFVRQNIDAEDKMISGYIETYFEKPIEMVRKKRKGIEEIRFLIAYEFIIKKAKKIKRKGKRNGM